MSLPCLANFLRVGRGSAACVGHSGFPFKGERKESLIACVSWGAQWNLRLGSHKCCMNALTCAACCPEPCPYVTRIWNIVSTRFASPYHFSTSIHVNQCVCGQGSLSPKAKLSKGISVTTTSSQGSQYSVASSNPSGNKNRW